MLELTLPEALSLGHNYIGTEHILLALGREGDGVAVRILRDLDADTEKIRNEVRRERVVAQDDAALRAQLRVFSRKRPRWGYRQAHQHLLDEGWSINRKRVQRLWREEGLRVPQKRRKRQRRGESPVPGDRLRAERPDHVWAFDFQFDVTEDGRAVKLLYVVDEFTREALAVEAERRIDGDRVVDVLDRIAATRGTHPEFVRCDTGRR